MFSSLELALTSAPVLALRRTKGRYTLVTDACDKSSWCVLLQEQKNKNNRAVSYRSRTLNNKEKIGHKVHGVPGSCMARHAFARLFVRNPPHNSDRPQSAPVDPYHGRGD